MPMNSFTRQPMGVGCVVDDVSHRLQRQSIQLQHNHGVQAGLWQCPGQILSRINDQAPRASNERTIVEVCISSYPIRSLQFCTQMGSQWTERENVYVLAAMGTAKAILAMPMAYGSSFSMPIQCSGKDSIGQAGMVPAVGKPFANESAVLDGMAIQQYMSANSSLSIGSIGRKVAILTPVVNTWRNP